MRSWDDVSGRRGATREFCKYMDDPNNAADRERCCGGDDAFSKELFARVCGYYAEGLTIPGQPPSDGRLKPIPREVVFKIFNSEDRARDNLVTMVLPPRGEDVIEPGEVWRCTWVPWVG